MNESERKDNRSRRIKPEENRITTMDQAANYIRRKTSLNHLGAAAHLSASQPARPNMCASIHLSDETQRVLTRGSCVCKACIMPWSATPSPPPSAKAVLSRRTITIKRSEEQEHKTMNRKEKKNMNVQRTSEELGIRLYILNKGINTENEKQHSLLRAVEDRTCSMRLAARSRIRQRPPSFIKPQSPLTTNAGPRHATAQLPARTTRIYEYSLPLSP